MRRYLPILALLLAAGCVPSTVKRSPAPASVPGSASSEQAGPSLVVREIRPGLWMHTSYSPDKDRFPSNGLIVREGKQVVLIDTAWGDAATEELLSWIRKNVKLPVARAIITHAHEDRMGGAATLDRRNIPFMGHPLTRQRALARGWPGPAALEVFTSSDVARVGFLELYYPGPGHAPDNIVVWVASERLLFGGCLVKGADAKDLGNVAESDLKRWAPSLRRVADRYSAATIVIPGHGEPGGLDLLAHSEKLLRK